MKVIDKRKKEKKWEVGDVIDYHNNGGKSNYGLIVGPTYGDEYYIAFFDKNGLSTDGFSHTVAIGGTSSVNELIRKISSNWDCVERVNAHLVVEDNNGKIGRAHV